MKIFVSSRMNELSIERKTAIDSLRFAGHTPLYIETEPMVKDEKAKAAMDSLIAKADALVSIHYLSEGRQESFLGDLTPIEYEIREFRKQHPEAPILVFRKEADHYPQPSPAMIDWFDRETRLTHVEVRQFRESAQLTKFIVEAVRELKLEPDPAQVTDRIIIRYTGADFIGLIESVSETIFSTYGMNIDYISHAARGGKATLYVSCSPRGNLPKQEELRSVLQARAVEATHVATSEGLLMPGADPNVTPQVLVELDQTTPLEWQFYVEIRTIDAPGQLNAICKVLKELKFNIDELQLKPTEREYRRQTTMNFSISKRDVDEPSECDVELMQLESAIRMLVGVRTFSIKVVTWSSREKFDRGA